MGSAKILIVEDEWLVANDLANALEQDGHHVVAIAGSSAEALNLAECHVPELVLMDLRLGDQLAGPDTAATIQAKHGSEIVFVTGHSEGEALDAAKQVRSSGYLVKPYSRQQLRASVEIALYNLSNRLKAPPANECEVVDDIQLAADPDEVLLRGLSDREREVFEYLAGGERVSDVASRLFISSHTVRKHSKAIFRKVGVHSQIELIRRFGRRRLPN